MEFRLWKKKNVFLFTVYLVIAVLVIPYVGQGLHYSVFYHPNAEYDHIHLLLDNAVQVKDAVRTLNNLDCTRDCLNKKNQAKAIPEYCFVIITVSRPVQTNFLTRVVAALLPQLPPNGFVFTVFNAEGPTHEEAMNLSSQIPVYTYAGDDGESSPNSYSKEKNDYVLALEWCHKRKARFSVILQDDALPRQDFMQRLQLIMNYRMSKSNSEWIFLKLYYPEKWQGWGNEKNIVIELIVCAILGGFILTLILCCLQSLITQTLKVDHHFIIQFLLSSVFIAYILLALGRPHWIALRYHSTHLSSVVYAPECCIPAVLYPQTHLGGLIQYLKESKCSRYFPVDLAMDKFADKQGLLKQLAIPNLVEHIGFISSLPGKGWKNTREFMLNA